MTERRPEQPVSPEQSSSILPPSSRGSERFKWKMAFVFGLSCAAVAVPVTELAIFIRDNFTQVPLTPESASHARMTWYTLGAVAGGLWGGFVGGKHFSS